MSDSEHESVNGEQGESDYEGEHNEHNVEVNASEEVVDEERDDEPENHTESDDEGESDAELQGNNETETGNRTENSVGTENSDTNNNNRAENRVEAKNDVEEKSVDAVEENNSSTNLFDDTYDDGGSDGEESGELRSSQSMSHEQSRTNNRQKEDGAEKRVESEAEGGDEVEREDFVANLFGDDSDEEEEEPGEAQPQTEGEGEQIAAKADFDEDEPRFLRVEMESDGEVKEWDFDIMLKKKKAEKRKRRRKDGTISLISDADDQIKQLIDAMAEAANDDRQSNMDKRPAIQKRKMLSVVRNTLLKADLFETLLDNGMMSAVSDWLAPLPDKSLPALEVRSTLLKILQSYPGLEQGILKQSGLGKAVMFLFKHPKETRENKTIAAKLIREWSRPIFQLETDFRSLSREERSQRDYAHMPETKRKRLSMDDDGMLSTSVPSQARRSGASSQQTDDDSALRPGDAGFIMRARVPKPSTKDYVVRPRSLVDGNFQGPSKNRTTDRFDRAQREFRERNRSQKVKRAVGVSLEGRKMDL